MRRISNGARVQNRPWSRLQAFARNQVLGWGSVALALACLLGGAREAQAQRKTGEIEVKAGQAILMDAETGAILYQLNADAAVAPAGFAKLMTLAVAFKLIKAGKLKRSDQFVMTSHAWRTGGWGSGMQAMMVPVNRQATLEELIQGVAIWGGNDAAIAIAEGIAGTEAKFALLMQEEAQRIGLPGSTFKNPTGFADPAQQTTVKDVAVLARHLIDSYPDQIAVFAQREFLYRRHKLTNRHPLLNASTGVDGMIVTDLARTPKGKDFGMVTTAKRGGRRLVVVVHGAASAAARQSESNKLLEWGFKNIRVFKLFGPDETVGVARVWGGSVMYLPLIGNGDVSVWLPQYPASQKLRGEIVYDGPLKAPIKKGQEVARLRVTSSNSAVQEVPLYASRDVAESGLVWRGLDSLAHLAFRLLPL